MSEQLTLIIQRLQRLETKLDKVLGGEVTRPKRMKEADVIKEYGVGRYRLQQLRRGYKKNGIQYDPVLFKWAHRNGRDIDYDVAELDEVFKRTPII